MHTYIPRKPDRTGKVLVGLGLFFVVTMLVLPLVLIFFSAFRSGWQLFTSNLMDSDMISAIKLTLLVAVLTVPVNVVFGTLIAWCVTKFQFFRKKLRLEVHTSELQSREN